MENNGNYFTVKEVNLYIKARFDADALLNKIMVKGEISNFKQYPKALYFSLKDQESKLSVVMFMYGKGPDFIPKDGDEVIISGSLSVYPKEGTYQLYGKTIEKFGQGNQLLALQQLKEKLFKEGLFDEKRKRKIPLFPKRIGIIAGKDSAALKDLTYNLSRRYPLAAITFIPSLVQGINAITDLKRAVLIAKGSNLDVLIIARGGGAEEDLSAFNDESLVRSIADAPMPTIAAIGHEINLSLVDLVADKRASTPTAAAEFAVPNQEDLRQFLKDKQTYMITTLKRDLSNYRQSLSLLASRPVLTNPKFIYSEQRLRLTTLQDSMMKTMASIIDRQLSHYQRLKVSLDALSPYAVLKRGYAINTLEDGTPLTSIKDAKLGKKVKTILEDGYFISEIKERG
jgi:exodeoxyribonuclease VII large subunit